MSLGKKLFIGGGGGGGVTCFTDSVQPFGVDSAYSSNVALYQLDGNANDTVGNHNGTASTSVTYSQPGIFGGQVVNQCAVFNGSTTTQIEIPDSNSFSPASNPITVSMWVKTTSTADYLASKAQYVSPSNQYEWGLSVDSSGNLKLECWTSAGSSHVVLTSSANINDGNWHHVAFSILHQSEYKLYADGLNVASTSSYSNTMSNTAANVYLGARGDTTNERYTGSIDQVRFFDRVLSDYEISILYNETVSTASDTNVLGEGSGLALYSLDYDASDAGGNYDGTPTDVEFGVDGQINWGASFNGSSSYIDTNLQMPSTTTFTFSCWFYKNDSANYHLIGDFNSTATLSSGRFRVQIASNEDISVGVGNGTNMDFSVFTPTVSLNQIWRHITVTVDGTSVKAYIDGSQVGTTDTSQYSLASGVNNFAIGAYNTSSGKQNFNGTIDQVRIFQKALSSDEVSTLYGETACVYTSTTDQVNYQGTNAAYYKFDNTAEDETGNYDGTESNITYEFGRFGQAAVFNGSSSNIFNSNRTSTQTTTITLSAWINTTDTTSSMQILQTESLWLRANQVWRIDNANGTGAYRRYDFTQSTIATGNWVHVCVVRDGNSVTLYVNNSAVSFSSETTSSNSGVYDGISIGARNRSSDSNKANFFDGKIDQVRMYNSALDATAVENLYNEKQAYITKNASDPFGDNSEVAFYEFENNANDSTGSNDGTPASHVITYTSGVGLFGTYALYGRGGGGITNTSLGTAFRGQTTLSLSAWFNGENTTYRQTIFSFSDTNDGSTDLWIGIVAGNNTLGFRNVNNGSNNLQVNATGGSSVMDGKWHHVVFTADSGGTHIYVDGLELTGFSYSFGNSSTNIVMPNDLNQFNIGVNEDSTGFEWEWNDLHHISGHQGYLDQIRVFNRALDGDEVFQLWAEHIN